MRQLWSGYSRGWAEFASPPRSSRRGLREPMNSGSPTSMPTTYKDHAHLDGGDITQRARTLADHAGLPSVATRPPLDVEIISRLQSIGKAIGEDLLHQLTVVFLTNADAQLLQLRRAVATGDSDATFQLSHALRGSSATLGAADLASRCSALEGSDAALNRSGRDQLVEAIHCELERVRLALKELTATA
jgi:HPt (histidine-containing phosphotransfer) domain-containing protein